MPSLVRESRSLEACALHRCRGCDNTVFLECNNLSWQKAISQTGKTVSYPVAVPAKQRQNKFCSLKANIWKQCCLSSAHMVCPAQGKEMLTHWKKQMCIWAFALPARVSKLRMLLAWHLGYVYSYFYLQNVCEQNLRGSVSYDFQQSVHLLLITNGQDLLIRKYNRVKNYIGSSPSFNPSSSC